MSDMFCYQCQQTAGNKGCVKVGVCGKQPDTAGRSNTAYNSLFHAIPTMIHFLPDSCQYNWQKPHTSAPVKCPAKDKS